jgi:hypothetical protein
MWTGSITQISIPSSARDKSHAAPAWLLARLAAEADLRFCPQAYASVSAFFEFHQLPMPCRQGPQWRLTERLVGTISGLPMSFGHLTATNGIMCYIETSSNGIYLGHLKYFEKVDLADLTVEEPTATEPKSKRKARRYSADEVDALLEGTICREPWRIADFTISLTLKSISLTLKSKSSTLYAPIPHTT